MTLFLCVAALPALFYVFDYLGWDEARDAVGIPFALIVMGLTFAVIIGFITS